MENYFIKLLVNVNHAWIAKSNENIANIIQQDKSTVSQPSDCFISSNEQDFANHPKKVSAPVCDKAEKVQDNQASAKYHPSIESGNRRIKTITVSSKSPFSDGLKKLSTIEGFNCENLDSMGEWLEDWRIPLNNGKFLLPNIPENLHYDFLKLNKAFLTDSGINVFSTGNRKYLKLDKYIVGNSYIEGGNLLTIKKANGDIAAIVGIDSVIATQRIMDAGGKFDNEMVKKQIDIMEKSNVFTEELLSKTNKQFGTYIQVLEKHPQKILKIDDFPSENDRSKDFLAKLELAKLEIAKDLCIKLENITFITQPDFHIDMDLRPIGDDKNSILLSSSTEAIKLINNILSDPEKQEELDKIHLIKNNPKFTFEETQRKHLKFLLNDTLETAVFIDKKLKKVKSELQAAGYNVIDFPGKPGTGSDVNYLNSIVGVGNNGKFYVTGATIEYQYGLFTEAIETILKDLGFDNVYFIGDPKEVAFTLSREMGGLDCATNEITD